MRGVVPSAAFQEQTVSVDTELWLGSHILILQVVFDNKLEGKPVNSNTLTTSVVLSG